jgi:hypothetical protein
VCVGHESISPSDGVVHAARHYSSYSSLVMLGSDLTDRTRDSSRIGDGQPRTGPFLVHIWWTRSDGQLSDRSVGPRTVDCPWTVRGLPADRSVGPCPTDVNRETDRSVSGPLDLNRALNVYSVRKCEAVIIIITSKFINSSDRTKRLSLKHL